MWKSLHTFRIFQHGAMLAGDASAKALKQVFISEVSTESYPTALLKNGVLMTF